MARVKPYVVPALIGLGLLALASRIPFLVAVSGKDEPKAPAACRAGPGAVRAALATAPGPVRIDGAPLSSCLARRSEPAEVQEIGSELIDVASGLSREAGAHPQGPAATQLGYLIGAVRRGAARTQGIHAETVRRLEQELLLVDTRSGAFREGERAGWRSG